VSLSCILNMSSRSLQSDPRALLAREAGQAKKALLALQVGTVLMEWVSNQPYQSVVQCTAPGCRIVGLNISHTSPSVANNFAVYNQVIPAPDAAHSDSICHTCNNYMLVCTEIILHESAVG